ncbi:YdcF family protein [Nocardiopsis alba]|uniref:YdcF family protein n=1 Tax=Nocardiopsis alba TaxID=53437 RepID=UPI00339DD4F6
MRTASDGRGDEAWDRHSAVSADDEATRVFSRGGPADVPTGSETTRDFTRAPEPTGSFPRETSDDATRVFDPSEWNDPDERTARTPASDPDSEFTRRFVRERPGSRSRVGGSAPRETYRTEPFEPEPFEPGPPVPGEDPENDPRRGDFDGFDDSGGSGGGPGRGRRSSGDDRPPHRPKRRKRRRFRLRRIIAVLLLLLVALPPATWGWVWYTARQDDRDASDAIIVLGASQYNGVPSPVFEARLRQAQVLYQEGVAPMIVTVGGKQPDDAYTEAAAGRNWLVEVGIPADHVIAVEEGRDTLQSFQAVSEVFEANHWETAILVSDPWHSLRSKVMAADHGIEAGTSPARSGPAVIERRTQLWYITRETASLWYYWIFNDSSDIRVNAA